MLIDRVVVNASPLICLFKSGLEELFPALFKDVVVPEAVIKEVMAKGTVDLTAQTLVSNTWIEELTEVRGTRQALREIRPIKIGPKYRVPLNPSANHVMQGSRGIQSGFSRHGHLLRHSLQSCQVPSERTFPTNFPERCTRGCPFKKRGKAIAVSLNAI